MGETFGAEHAECFAGEYGGRQLSFKLGMSAIRSYEFEISRALMVWIFLYNSRMRFLAGIILSIPSKKWF